MTSGSLAGASQRRAGGAGGLAAASSALLLGVLMALSVVAAVTGASLGGGAETAAEAAGDAPSALAQREIPPRYLRLYEEAARRNDLDWAILAGIGKVECDHGRDTDPSCTREGATNAAGAGGPMQFIGSTWTTYGVDGDGDGRADRWDPVDAIYAAANFLAHAGAPGDYRRAIFAYNHAGWYVVQVQEWAARYRGSSLPSAPDSPLTITAPRIGRRGGPGIRPSAGLAGRDDHAGAVHRRRTRDACARRRACGFDSRRCAGRRGGDARFWQRAASSAVRTWRTSRPARCAGRGLLEHRELRPLPLGPQTDRRNPRHESARPRLRQLGRVRAPAAG